MKLPRLKLPALKLPKFSARRPEAVLAQPLAEGDAAPAEAGAPAKKPGKLSAKTRFAALGLGLAILGGGGFAAWRLTRPAPQVAATEKPAEHAPPAVEQHAAAAPAESHAEPKHEAAEAKEGGHGGGEKPGKDKPVFTPLTLAPPSEIIVAVRRLQVLQEKVAAGDSAAFAEMPKFLRAMTQKLAAQPPDAWAQPDNARALLLYLLSGGNAALARRILAQGKLGAGEEALVKGAIAYLEGVEGPERDVLLSLDPRAMDPNLGAQIAFVQSILLTGADRPEALRKLDLARLLAPGGLVEEAALRREVGLLAETRQFAKFAELARQYWARFRASPYAENFLRQFMLASARISLSINVKEWTQLEEFIQTLTPETRRGLYLTMAQTASVAGNNELAALAAHRALDLAPEDAPEQRRAQLYLAAASVGGAPEPASAELLKGVSREKLEPGDQPLFDAVTMVSARMFRPPEKDFASEPRGAPNAADPEMARAEAKLREGDVVLDEARKSMERKIK